MRALACLSCLSVFWIGCSGGGGGGGPTAPGTAVLAITVSPSVIGSSGTADIAVLARHADGSAQAGAVVEVEATLGVLEASSLATGADGRAATRLRGDGRTGTATVRAHIGASGPSAQATLRIEDALLALQAVPVAIATDGRATLFATVQDSAGKPVGAGVRVSLSTTLGRLEDSVPVTDSLGHAITTLVAEGAAGKATVRASVQGSVAELEVEIGQGLDLTLRAAPVAIPADGSTTITLLAVLPDGHPVAIGTQVLFTTSLGRLDVDRVPVAETALATTILRGTGNKGTARVTAQVVGFAETATLDVPIG